ncbi:hypothetical protein OIO90_005987 [Microbotryomycetes sp. JL221]|nr:hypothetical protein OIO90_005987 [Microbotryomycetes sp. JL221]
MENQPIAIATKATASLSSASLPEPLRQLLHLRMQADSALQHPALKQEVEQGHHGHQASTVRDALTAIVDKQDHWKAHAKLSVEDEARGVYVIAWALGRIGEYDGTDAKSLPTKLRASLSGFERAASLLNIPMPPTLDNVPSVARPREGSAPLSLPPVTAWATEMLAEWARTQTTLAFSIVLADRNEVDAIKLAELLELACRRNVQALFTPVDPLSASEEELSPYAAGTVVGNARLIRDMMTMLPFTNSAKEWTRRLQLATHVADVRFAELSMTANKLADEASNAASVLQNKSIDEDTRQHVRFVLERIAQDMLPVERCQGVCLMMLGRVMLEAVSAVYLKRKESLLAVRRRRDSSRDPQEEEDKDRIQVPENELVRETRQVFIRAAALLENAYASFLRAPSRSRNKKKERKLLRRLESTYCNLEELDNEAPETQQLRSERVERALWINDRLLALGDTEEDEQDESDEEEDSDEDENDEDILARRLAQSINI